MPTIFHGGRDTGFIAFVALMPNENIGFVLASNDDRAPLGSIRDGLIDILLGEEPERPLRPIGNDFAKVYVEEGLESAKSFYRRVEETTASDYFFSGRQLNSIGIFLLMKET